MMSINKMYNYCCCDYFSHTFQISDITDIVSKKCS